jgi:hypothetical protein
LCQGLLFYRSSGLFLPLPCFFYYYSSVVLFADWYCVTSSTALLDQHCFGYSRSLVLPNEL